jgi:hypothetical protein
VLADEASIAEYGVSEGTSIVLMMMKDVKPKVDGNV